MVIGHTQTAFQIDKSNHIISVVTTAAKAAATQLNEKTLKWDEETIWFEQKAFHSLGDVHSFRHTMHEHTVFLRQ